MKILQVARRFVSHEWGGTENVISNVSKRLLAAGYYTELWTSSALSKPGQAVVAGLPVRRFNYVYPFAGLDDKARAALDKKGGNLFSLSMMGALALRSDFDVYHLHTGKRFGAQVAYVAQKRKRPYIVTLHGGYFNVPQDERSDVLDPVKGKFEWGKPIGALLGSRTLLKNADAVLCVNPAEVQQVRAEYPGKLAMNMPNGVDPKVFESGDGRRFKQHKGFKQSDRLVVCISRIDHQKNQLGLVKAFARLSQKSSSLQLVLIGPQTNPAYAEKVEDEARRLGVADRVHLMPPLKADSGELADAYAAASVFVLPSLHEPFGIVVLEAWAAGKPVVAARVGGLAEFVEDGCDGLLFSHDEEDGMFLAIKAVLDDRNLACRLAKAGNKKVLENYTWDMATERLLRLYESLMR